MADERESEALRGKPRFLIALLAVVAPITAIEGCTTAPSQSAYDRLPQYCTYTTAGGAAPGTLVGDNLGPDTGTGNAATGAIIGALLGAGIGAAIGGGRGAAVGGDSGLAGTTTAAQADAQCRQLAYQWAHRKG